MRWCALLGVAGGVGYVVGDVLLYAGTVDHQRHPVLARDGVDQEAGVMTSVPSARLRAGALAGVLSAPLYVGGTASLIRRLAPGGGAPSGTAAVGIGLLLAAYCVETFVHGSFYPYGETMKRADEAIRRGESEEVVADLLRAVKRFERTVSIPFALYGALVAAGSIAVGVDVVRGRTDLPRWAAPLVAPLVPMAGALAALMPLPLRPEPLKHAVRGSSLSLGVLASFAAVAALPRRKGHG